MASRWIYLVRHGQYRRLSTDDLVDGSEAELPARLDGGLTALGREQAALTARRLGSLPIDVIHCSSLPRAVETAEIIARELPGVPLRKTRVLWECIPYVPAGAAGLFPASTPEELAEHQAQAEKAYARYFRRTRGDDRHEILVCHGNLMRYFVARALKVGAEAWYRMGIFNCGMSLVEVRSTSTGVVSHNDSGHLPEDKRTGS